MALEHDFNSCVTDRPTDGPTAKPSYRNARKHLKMLRTVMLARVNSMRQIMFVMFGPLKTHLKISASSWCTSWAREGRHFLTAKSGGAGFLLRHRLEMVQVTLRTNPSDRSGFNRLSSGSNTPPLITASRNWAPSPAMLPRAQTACSHTLVSLDLKEIIVHKNCTVSQILEKMKTWAENDSITWEDW